MKIKLHPLLEKLWSMVDIPYMYDFDEWDKETKKLLKKINKILQKGENDK